MVFYPLNLLFTFVQRIKQNDLIMKKLFSFVCLLASLTVSAQSLPDLIKNGNSKLSAGNFAGAEQDFSNAIKLNDQVVNAYLDKMKKYGTLNEFQRTTSDMPDGFVYNHDLAVPYYGRGMAYEGLSKNEEALADYEKAIAIDPKYADALCQRGIVLIGKGIKDKGCLDLKKAGTAGNAKAKELFDKNACSDIAKAFISAGDAKFDAKDYNGALADYSSAVQLNKESFDAFIKRGKCNVQLKKYAKAISDYDKALKIKNDTVQVLYLRGLAYNASENFVLAFNDFSCVIRLEPNNYDAFMARAYSCEGMQKFRSAVYDYSECIRIKPDDGNAYYKRGLVTQDAKDGSACKDFKKAAALGLDDAKQLADGCNAPPAPPK